MIAKNTTLAVAIVCGFSLSAKAEDIKTYETLQVSCNPFTSDSINSQCSSNSSVESEADLIAQNRRGRGRRRKSKVQNYYAGFGIGAMLPSGEVSFGTEEGNVDFSTGFAGSIFGGLNFSKNIGAELEFLLGFGGGDTDDFEQSVDDAIAPFIDEIEVINNQLAALSDLSLNFDGEFESSLDYSVFALYASPRFNLPVSERFSVFISPGIGLSQTNVNLETDNSFSFSRSGSSGDPQLDAELDQTIIEGNADLAAVATDRDSSKTGISFQIKAGASFLISETIGIFGSVRYVTLPTESNDEFDSDSLNSFATQAGLTFNF